MIRKLFITSVCYAILILVVCVIPGSGFPRSPLFSIPHFDKLVHAILYFPLAVFIIAEFDLSRSAFLRLSGPILTLLIIAAYGGLIEIAQKLFFRYRSGDLVDFLFDVIGGLSGMLVYYLFLRPFFRRLSEHPG